MKSDFIFFSRMPVFQLFLLKTGEPHGKMYDQENSQKFSFIGHSY